MDKSLPPTHWTPVGPPPTARREPPPPFMKSAPRPPLAPGLRPFRERRAVAILTLLAAALPLGAQDTPPAPREIAVQKDLSYVSSPGDAYEEEQCRLDVYLPKDVHPDTPLLVWFHGGGLKGGSRTSGGTVAAARSLAESGVAVIVPGYRLSPRVTFPAYVRDAARAVRWAVDHADEWKIRPKVYVGGHSAGGYLAALLAMDPRYLAEAGVSPESIAGFVCMSGQMTTHFTVAEERGIRSQIITADDAAPIHHLRRDIAPMLVLVGENDWPARVEENAYFVAAMRRVAECPHLSFQVLPERTHGGILQSLAKPEDPTARVVREFLRTGVLPPDHAPSPPQPNPAKPQDGSSSPSA